jgi:hypothetical protein
MPFMDTRTPRCVRVRRDDGAVVVDARAQALHRHLLASSNGPHGRDNLVEAAHHRREISFSPPLPNHKKAITPENTKPGPRRARFGPSITAGSRKKVDGSGCGSAAECVRNRGPTASPLKL